MAQGGAGLLFVVSGPSGSGKTTIVEHLLRSVPDTMFSVSYTTREPRPGEREGVDYRFVSRQEFERMLERGEFLEHAEVFGNYYGTHRSALESAQRQGKDLVLDIDVEGARQVKARIADAVGILLLPPSEQELARRLRNRAVDSPNMVQQRLERARKEIGQYETYDYLVVNRTLADTCVQVEAILLAERCRRDGQAPATPQAREAEKRAAAARKSTNRTEISAILESFGVK